MLEIRAQKAGFSNRVDILICDESPGMGFCVADRVELRVVEPSQRDEETNPTASLGVTAAQKLMDDLWNCGLRPSEGSGSAGALLATQKHLDDMRTIALNPGKVLWMSREDYMASVGAKGDEAAKGLSNG
jgi:hypothetical protein